MSSLRPVALALTLATLAVPTAALADPLPYALGGSSREAPAKLDQVLKFMRLTGANNLADQMVQQMLASFQQAYPKVPASFWRSVIKKNETDKLIRQVAQIYGQYLTQHDVKELIAFYSSPVGRKFVAMQPKLVQESMVFGQQWGERMSQRVMKELKRKKYIQ